MNKSIDKSGFIKVPREKVKRGLLVHISWAYNVCKFNIVTLKNDCVIVRASHKLLKVKYEDLYYLNNK